MKSVKIEIVNTKLDDLGIDQEPIYVPFRFNEKLLVGYWVDSKFDVIAFYIGSCSFICKHTTANIYLFESILKNEI